MKFLTVPRLVFAALVFLNCVVLIKIQYWEYVLGLRELWDFDIYHRMVNDVLAGSNPYSLAYMQTSGPPLVILPFVFFSWMPLVVGRGVVSLLSLFAIFATSWLLARYLHRSHTWAATLAFSFGFLVTFPVRFNFDVGQLNLVLMAFVTLLLTTKNQVLQSVLAGVMIVMKTNYLVLLASWVRKQSKNVVITIGVLVALTLISLLLFRPNSYQTYLTQKASGYVLIPSPTIDTDYYNQSLRATMARFQLGGLYLPIFVVMAVFGGLYLLYSGDVYAGVILSILLSPIVWQHYLPVVYPLVILMGHKMFQRRRMPVGFPIAAGLVVLHMPWLHEQPLSLVRAVLASHYFFGIAILLGTWLWWRSSSTMSK